MDNAITIEQSKEQAKAQANLKKNGHPWWQFMRPAAYLPEITDEATLEKKNIATGAFEFFMQLFSGYIFFSF